MPNPDRHAPARRLDETLVAARDRLRGNLPGPQHQVIRHIRTLPGERNFLGADARTAWVA